MKCIKLKKFICLVLACAVFAGCQYLDAEAAQRGGQEMEPTAIFASEKFAVDIPKNTFAKLSKSYSLEAGETVTIKASYSPSSASVDFGLIDSNGNFYYVNVKDGIINKTIKVDVRGEYILAIKNNSSAVVNVSGHVDC